MKEIREKVTDFLLDVIDTVKYDILKFDFAETEFVVPSLHFHLEIQKDGAYLIADDVPGLLVSTKKVEELPDALFDALLVYYDIPRYQARKMMSSIVIKMDTGKIYSAKDTTKYKFA